MSQFLFTHKQDQHLPQETYSIILYEVFQWFQKNGCLRHTVHLQAEILTAKTEIKKYFPHFSEKGKFIFSKENQFSQRKK